MSFFSLRRLGKSFKYALKGLSYALRYEQNFRVELIAALLVIIVIFIANLAVWERVALFMMILLVLMAELINSIFEKMADMLKPRLHHYVHIIKDLMAAVVLLASLGAVVVGVLILGPHFLKLFSFLAK